MPCLKDIQNAGRNESKSVETGPGKLARTGLLTTSGAVFHGGAKLPPLYEGG